MKNTSLILSIISLVAVVAFGILSLTKGGKSAEAQTDGTAVEAAASKGDIVYVNLDRILMEYDMANDLRSVVETKVQNIQAEVNRRAKKLESDVIDFQNKIDKGLLTRTNAEVQSHIVFYPRSHLSTKIYTLPTVFFLLFCTHLF